MDTSDSYPVRIDGAKFGKRGTVYLGLSYLVLLLVFFIAGVVGPDVETIVTSEVVDVTSTNFTMDLAVSELEPVYQALWIELDLLFSNPADYTFTESSESAEIAMKIDVWEKEASGRYEQTVANRHITRKTDCKNVDGSNVECKHLLIFTQRVLDHDAYRLEIQFLNLLDFSLSKDTHTMACHSSATLHHINEAYSNFEVYWRFVFILMLLGMVVGVCGGGFLPQLFRLPLPALERREVERGGKVYRNGCFRYFRHWGHMQRWLVFLAPFLILFNDPFLPLYLYAPTDQQSADKTHALLEGYMEYRIVNLALFVSLLLFFFLCFFHQIKLTTAHFASSSPSDFFSSNKLFSRDNFRFYLPKAALSTIIFALFVSVSLYMWRKESGDVTYLGLADTSSELIQAEVALLVFLVIYLVYLLFLMLSPLCSCSSSDTEFGPASGGRLRLEEDSLLYIASLSSPLSFVYLLSILVLVAIVSMLFYGAYYPLQSSSAVLFIMFYALVNTYFLVLYYAYTPLDMEEQYDTEIETGFVSHMQDGGTILSSNSSNNRPMFSAQEGNAFEMVESSDEVSLLFARDEPSLAREGRQEQGKEEEGDEDEDITFETNFQV